MNFDTPVLLVIFNRPDCARRALEAVKNVLPSKLYISADGPRSDKPSDYQKCMETRKVVESIDWPCKVETLFRDKNLGCGKALAQAITWFFDREESGIIIEDDCIPDPSFFFFCDELLAKYKDDSRVMHISGINHNPKDVRDNDYSYFFSKLGHSWGWATWRRAWKFFDYSMKNLEEVHKKGYFNDIYPNWIVRKYFQRKVIQTYKGEIDTWDYQWEFCRLIHSGLSITPTKNLVRNIGFGEDATHTFNEVSDIANVVVEKLKFPLQHPPFLIKDSKMENRYFFRMFISIIKRKLLYITRIS
tara:strand:+ start:651 stop:1556 length:906 start_codon:yes stop_codon:yes gene_type:complete